MSAHYGHKAEDRGHETPCWIWQGWGDGQGYGKLWHDGRHVKAHIFVYEQHRGAVPAGLELDHLCRVRACVNPAHLEPVAHAENCRRGAAAKLTRALVTEIRLLLGQGWLQADVAAAYGVNQPHVSRIKCGTVWA